MARRVLLLILGLWLLCCAQVSAELQPPALATGKTAADYGGQSVLILHYRRDAADYTGWNLWAWPVGAEGASFAFTGSDAFGVYGIAVFEEAHPKLGFLVRKGDWEEKDGDQDRMVELGASGVAEVWVRQDRLTFDTTPPWIDEAQDVKPAGQASGGGGRLALSSSGRAV